MYFLTIQITKGTTQMKKLVCLFLMVTTFAVSGLSVALANPAVGKATATQTVLVSDQELAENVGGSNGWVCFLSGGLTVIGVLTADVPLVTLGLYGASQSC
jgi:hypothetical protein